MNNSVNRYYIKRNAGDTFVDITTLFGGLAVLSIDGMDEVGDAVNVYHEQWVDTQAEDFLVCKQDEQLNPVVIRANVDLKMTVIVSRRYTNQLIDEQTVYDSLVDYICRHGDFYIRSLYSNKDAHVVCLKSVKPTAKKLHRGIKSYIMATIELHTLDVPTVSVQPVGSQELYIGFGNEILTSLSDITSLLNVQHYTADNIHGDYSITCPSTKYLWICSTMDINSVTSSGFEVPLNSPLEISSFKCYRSGNAIVASPMSFTINT